MGFLDNLYAARLRVAELLLQRGYLEHRIMLRRHEIEMLKARAHLKVSDRFRKPQALLSEEEKKSYVVIELANNKQYRQALNSVDRGQLRINRLNAEIAVLEASIERLLSEKRLGITQRRSITDSKINTLKDGAKKLLKERF
ncbi:MAG: hypothetical protein AB1599_05840 [Planctomycetota bacterium]